MENKLVLLIEQNQLLLNLDFPSSGENNPEPVLCPSTGQLVTTKTKNKANNALLNVGVETNNITDDRLLVKEEEDTEASDEPFVNDQCTRIENEGLCYIESVFPCETAAEEELEAKSDSNVIDSVIVKSEPLEDDNDWETFEYDDSLEVSHTTEDFNPSDTEVAMEKSKEIVKSGLRHKLRRSGRKKADKINDIVEPASPLTDDSDAMADNEDCDDETIYPCPLCGCHVMSFETLQRHKEKAHASYSCDQCVFSAQEACQLKEHKDFVHSGLQRNHKKNKFLCDQCDFSFTRSQKLKLHKDADHFGKRYKCGRCSTLFKRLDHLKRHKLNKHSLRY